MTQQAKNFINICKNGNPSTIEGLLHFQSPSIKKELKQHFDVDSDAALATALSLQH